MTLCGGVSFHSLVHSKCSEMTPVIMIALENNFIGFLSADFVTSQIIGHTVLELNLIRGNYTEN